tara:strand:- start:4494 stop:4961 length:468 start_codon:yes stop_codon:yes gene_type:complete
MSFDKTIWGNTTWYLFHTLIHKIKENEFLSVKNDFIYIIKTVCGNLPCPECSHDATQLLNKVDFNNINSKQEFKLLLFNFHNKINTKLNKPLFNKNDLDDKYSQANFDIIFNNFFIIYGSNSNTPQLMSQSFHRQHNLPKIKNSIEKIMTKFSSA